MNATTNRLAISRSALTREATRAASTAGRDKSLPVLAMVALRGRDDFLSLYSTDTEVTYSSKVPATVGMGFEVAVSAADLSRILARMGGDVVRLHEHGKQLVIECGGVRSCLPTTPVEEMPIAPEFVEDSSAKIRADHLLDMLAQSCFCIGKPDQQNINGASIEHADGVMRVVATNSHQLAYAEAPAEGSLDSRERLLSPKVIGHLGRLLKGVEGTVDVGMNFGSIRIRWGTSTFLGRMLVGQFPAYRLLIPADFRYEIEFSVPDIDDACKTSAALAKPATCTKVTADGDGATFTSANEKGGQTTVSIDCVLSGEDITFGMNPSYLREIAKASGAERIRVRMNGPMAVATIQPTEDTNCMFLLMPMRID